MPCPDCGSNTQMHNSWCRIHEDKTKYANKKRVKNELWNARDNPSELIRICDREGIPVRASARKKYG